MGDTELRWQIEFYVSTKRRPRAACGESSNYD